jgi:hypothetical protein
VPRLVVLLSLALGLAACDASDDLVGTWMPAGAADGSRTTFFADGTSRIVTRGPDGAEEAYDARYTVSGDTLLALSDGQGTERFRFRVGPDSLVLEDRLTRTRTVLVRVRA